MRTTTGVLIAVLLLVWSRWCGSAAVQTPMVTVVAHVDTPPLTEDVLQKLYLGKVVEVDGRTVIPVNLAKGHGLRQAFLERVLAQDEDKFVAYWTVRRYIGKGSPPREFSNAEQLLEFIRTTPGAVGYVDGGTEVKGSLKAVFKSPR